MRHEMIMSRAAQVDAPPLRLPALVCSRETAQALSNAETERSGPQPRKPWLCMLISFDLGLRMCDTATMKTGDKKRDKGGD